MKNTNETSLPIIQKKGILGRIMKFFKKILYRTQSNYIQLSDENNVHEEKRNSFLTDMKFEQDPDKDKLLKIQDELEKRGINRKNAFELTKDLSDIEKQKLATLYKEQIRTLELSINNIKNKIIAIRGKI